MSKNKSLLKLEAEECKSVPTAREQDEAILLGRLCEKYGILLP